MDEDYFADDATLDALPEDELQALEDAAVRSTQFAQSQLQQVQQQSQQKQRQQQQYRQYQYYQSGRIQKQQLPPPQLPVGPPRQQQQARYQQRQTEYQRPIPSDYQTLPTLPYTNRRVGETQQCQPAPLPPPVENLPSSDDYGGFDETTELWDSVAPEAQPQDDQQYFGGGDGYGGQGLSGYSVNGQQQYENNNAVYGNERVALVGTSGEEMMDVEGVVEVNPDYYANQQLQQQQEKQLQQQDSIHMRELREMIGQVCKL